MQYTPATEDVCSENYKKKCYIEYARTAVTETVEKCIIPRERICSPPQYGEVSSFIPDLQHAVDKVKP